jgi:hypothetical protein
MKRLLVLALVCLAVVSCKKDDDLDSSSTRSSSYSDFMFSITVDGVQHKIEGSYGDHNMIYPAQINTNYCFFSIPDSSISTISLPSSLSARLENKTSSTYINGEEFWIGLVFPAISQGICQGMISPVAIENLFPSLANNPTSQSFSQINDTIFEVSESDWYLDFNITDLGTNTLMGSTSSNYIYDFGNPIRGNYSGTIYATNGNVVTSQGGDSGYIYDIPFQVEIEFIAARID